MWNFKGDLWNSTQNMVPMHWKICILFRVENLRALRCKSSLAFLKCPLYSPKYSQQSEGRLWSVCYEFQVWLKWNLCHRPYCIQCHHISYGVIMNERNVYRNIVLNQLPKYRIYSLWSSWCHVATLIYVNIGWGNGLVPLGTKPLPQPVLTL